MRIAKLFLGLSIPLVMFFASAPVYASGAFGVCNDSNIPSISQSTVCKTVKSNQNNPSNPILGTIKTVINILSYVIGVAAVITIMVAGFRLIMSEGKAENVNGARSAIIFAVVGIIISVFSQIILHFVLNRFQ